MRDTMKRVFIMMIVCVMMMSNTVTAEAKESKPTKTTVKSVSATDKSITVKFKKVKKASGYQIAYKTASAKKYTMKKVKKTSYVVKNVQKNTVYKIKVRAYNVKGKKTSYGKWSAVKTVSTIDNTCVHDWVTIVDKKAWDEPIYEEKEIWEIKWMWPDGTDASELAGCGPKFKWCQEHCTKCFPNCPDPDPQGRCALSVVSGNVYVGTEKVQVGTKHHDAVTHQECTKCGAGK